MGWDWLSDDQFCLASAAKMIRLRSRLDFSRGIGETGRLSRDQGQLLKKRDLMDTDYLAANRANWNERVESHLVAYGTDDFVAEPSAMSPVVRDDLALMAPFLPHGSVAGLRLVHLQCHIGTDTLSWARLGATVTGVDFSRKSIIAARDLASRAALDAVFVESTVDTAADHVDGQFDVVYTGIGAITWLSDLDKWATTVHRLLKPGGLFFIRDGHPILSTVDYERHDGELVITSPYFSTGAPLRFDDGTTYADDDVRLDNSTTYEWPHSLSEVIQPLLGVGLELLSFQEQTVIPWRASPSMVEIDANYALPDNRERLPLTFSLAARRSL